MSNAADALTQPLASSRSEPEPFFIVGCGRSGTTLLREMLNAHPRLRTPPECPFLLDYLRHPGMSMAKAAKLLANEPFIKDWKMGIRPADLSGCRTVVELVERLHRLYLTNTHGARWGQKTPKYVRFLPLVYKSFPKAKFIHMIRDARAVAASYLRATWGPTNAVAAAQYWRWNVLLGLRFTARHPEHCLTVTYEDLVNNTEEQLRRVLAFLDEPFDERVLHYEEHVQPMFRSFTQSQFRLLGQPIHTSQSNDWERRLTAEQVRRIEAVAGPLLRRLGYQLRNAPLRRLSTLQHRTFWALDKLGRATNHLRTCFKAPRHYWYEVRRHVALALETRGT